MPHAGKGDVLHDPDLPHSQLILEAAPPGDDGDDVDDDEDEDDDDDDYDVDQLDSW